MPGRKSTPREGTAPAKPQINPSGGRGSCQAANLYRLRWNFALPIHPWFQTVTQQPGWPGCNCALTQKPALQSGMTGKAPATHITTRAKSL